MEFELMVVTREQNTTSRGYGASAAASTTTRPPEANSGTSVASVAAVEVDHIIPSNLSAGEWNKTRAEEENHGSSSSSSVGLPADHAARLAMWARFYGMRHLPTFQEASEAFQKGTGKYVSLTSPPGALLNDQTRQFLPRATRAWWKSGHDMFEQSDTPSGYVERQHMPQKTAA